jgi:ATP-dependent Clp protease ATP-binding subunit ClpA
MERFIDIKTTFLLEGNVYDLCSYPSDDFDAFNMVLLDNYLYKYLKSKGYQAVVFYNHIDGFYCEFDKESLNLFIKAGKGQAENGQKQIHVPLSQSGDIVRQAMQNREMLVAVVFTLASRHVLSVENLSEAERDFYTKLMLCGLKKSQIKTSRGFQNNLLFLITEKANDVPVWLYLDNPMVKTLRVNDPDRTSRKSFLDSQFAYFLGADKLQGDEIERAKDAFVDLTDGFKNLELNALKAYCKKENIPIDNIREAINSYKYGIKENPWKNIETERINKAEEIIRRRVKGQDVAVIQTLDVIKRAASNMTGLQNSSQAKPKGILFFAGPTGTGKTELAKTIAELLFGDENACIRFDMSEYQQGHSDQKLLGAPPGYVGYEAGGQLTNAIREKPFSILLFDEIEKAHPSIFDKFLQILEDGRMTDGKGETVYFSECIIIFTSNLGIYVNDEYGHRRLNVSQDMNYETLKERLIKAIKDYFKLELGRPEILNRIGENFVVFDFIRDDVADMILNSKIDKIVANIKRNRDIDIRLSMDCISYLKQKSFSNLENGGRGIGNDMEKYFINPLSRYIFDNKVLDGTTINITSIQEENGIAKLVCEVA